MIIFESLLKSVIFRLQDLKNHHNLVKLIQIPDKQLGVLLELTHRLKSSKIK